MEDAMARTNPWSKTVPRVELDHRARNVRLKLIGIERLVVPRAAVPGFWLSRLVRLLGFWIYTRRRRGDRSGPSLRNGRDGCLPEIDPVWFEGCGAMP